MLNIKKFGYLILMIGCNGVYGDTIPENSVKISTYTESSHDTSFSSVMLTAGNAVGINTRFGFSGQSLGRMNVGFDLRLWHAQKESIVFSLNGQWRLRDNNCELALSNGCAKFSASLNYERVENQWKSWAQLDFIFSKENAFGYDHNIKMGIGQNINQNTMVGIAVKKGYIVAGEEFITTWHITPQITYNKDNLELNFGLAIPITDSWESKTVVFSMGYMF